jgi:hypothetical protein
MGKGVNSGWIDDEIEANKQLNLKFVSGFQSLMTKLEDYQKPETPKPQ